MSFFKFGFKANINFNVWFLKLLKIKFYYIIPRVLCRNMLLFEFHHISKKTLNSTSPILMYLGIVQGGLVTAKSTAAQPLALLIVYSVWKKMRYTCHLDITSTLCNCLIYYSKIYFLLKRPR